MTQALEMKNAIILSIILVFLSCKGQIENVEPPQSEQLYFNAQIYTVNPLEEWAEAMLVLDGRISAIGTEAELEELASENAERIDLQQKMIMPGIHDVHLHPLEAASENFQFILDGDETDPENYADIIIETVEELDATWILGWGFDIYTLLEANREPIEILDEISNTRPIAVMEKTSHSIWVNSKALELAGIDEQSPNPPGGIIMRDENGSPNGLLIDNAGNLIIDLAIASVPNNEQNDYEGLVNFALPELAKNGITSICDARTYWKRNHHLTWKKVADDGLLTARTNLGLWIYPDDNLQEQITTISSLYSYDSNSLLKINQIKLYADGIVINTTSAMHDNFLIDLFEEETNNGLNYLTENIMAAYIAALDPLGFDFHIHAIGDRGVHEALNAIEQSGSPQGRHRLTHVEYVNPADYSRFNALNVTADAQVAGDFTNPLHWHDNDELVDPSLNNAIVPIKDLVAADARLTLSSDWDVSALNPFIGLQNAVTRSPQNISVAEAVAAYTINPAYLMRQENLVGSLEAGKMADFIILNQNIFTIDPSTISSTKVDATYLEGELIYQR